MRPPSRIDRRSFLVTAAGALIWVACSDDSGGSDELPEGAIIGEGPFLRLGFSDGLRSEPTFIAGEEQRFPLSLAGADGFVLTERAPETVDVTITFEGEPVDTFTVGRHDDGILTPIYPLRFTPAVAGVYEFQVPDDEPRQVRVATRDEVPLVQPGDQLRAVDTPTTDDARGVTPICTRRPEPCPFHDLTLTEALDGAGPVILLVSTPSFCQTAICGPVLELLIESVATVPDARIVHAEVYIDPENAQSTGTFGDPTPVIETYALTYEPMLAVADANGVVTARLDYAWDRTELGAALATIS